MNKLKLVLLIALIFIAGFASGVVVTRLSVRHAFKVAIAQPDLVRARIERDLDRRLRLDPDQRVKVRRILFDAHSRLRALRQQYRPEFTAIMREANDEISSVLSPDQQKRFERYRLERAELLPPN